MKLTPEIKRLIQQSNNLGELREFIRQYLNIRYEWINKISDISLLKTIILSNLFTVINKTLTEDLSHKSQLEGLSIKYVKLLIQNNIYTLKQGERYILLLSNSTKQKNVSKSQKGNVKKSMSNPKKRKQKKAVSSWYLQLLLLLF